VDTTAGDDFLELCDQKSSYKRVSGFARWRGYECFLLLVNGQGTERRKSVRDIEPAGGLCNQLGGLSLALQALLFPPDSLRQLASILVVKFRTLRQLDQYSINLLKLTGYVMHHQFSI